MLAPAVFQYRYQQQATPHGEPERNEETIRAEVRALVKSAGNGVLWQVYTAKRKVRPSPAAFWRFVAAITPSDG
jgi:hypothetical protein